MALRVQQIEALRETIRTDQYGGVFRPNLEVTYLYGASGTGKTRSIFAKHDPRDICRIISYPLTGIRFDPYHGQKILVFEEFASQVPISDMLNYLDIYPIMLPARYSDRAACYEKVYITSNIPLWSLYKKVQEDFPDRWEAFCRRIHNIVEFTDTGSIIVRKGKAELPQFSTPDGEITNAPADTDGLDDDEDIDLDFPDFSLEQSVSLFDIDLENPPF